MSHTGINKFGGTTDIAAALKLLSEAEVPTKHPDVILVMTDGPRPVASECIMCETGVPLVKQHPIMVEVDSKVMALNISPASAARLYMQAEAQIARQKALEELYNAIQAIESNDLPFARSSAQRAANLVTECWQLERKLAPKEPT